MLWTLAVIADSGRAMYETMVRPLSDGEREGLWQDYVRFGELFGLPRERGARQLPRVRAPGSRANSPRPTCRRPSTRWRWRRWSPSAAGAGCRPRQPRDPEPHHQGDAAAAGAGDLRHPLEPPPTSAPSGRWPPPTAAPAAPSRADAPRPQRLLLRRRHPARAAARRHPHAAGPQRRRLRAPSLGACSSCSPSRRPGPRRGHRTPSPAPAR